MTRWICLACLLLAMTTAAFAADPPAPAGHDGPAAATEKPSLLPTPKAAIIPAVTTLVVFSLLLALLGKFAWGPIAAGLAAREEKIRREIADAEEARTKAESTLRQYSQQLAQAEQQVRDLLARAQQDGERLATNIRMQAQQEAEDAKTKATRDIDAARKAAVAELHAHAAELSTSIAEKILRRNLNAADQQDLVARSLDQLKNVSVN